MRLSDDKTTYLDLPGLEFACPSCGHVETLLVVRVNGTTNELVECSKCREVLIVAASVYVEVVAQVTAKETS